MTTKDSEQDRRPVSSFTHGWTILRVRGVPIRLDVSWLLICGLVIYVLITRFSTLLAPYPTVTLVASAAVGALLFFASILAHELGHTITSLDRGIPVASVTLFLMGGVTESTREPARARDEVVIVGAGPFISLTLASLFGLLYAISPETTPYGVVTGYVAWMNLALAVFNVLPGYPLDGGRLLRAVLWGASGNRHAATRWAARVGQVFAAVVFLGGVNGLVGMAFLDAPGVLGVVVRTLAANGLWGMLIGFFLLRGATEAHRQAAQREQFAARTVGQLMGQVPPTLPADLSLNEAIGHLELRPSLLFPVGDPLVGGVSLADVAAVPMFARATTTLGDIATRAQEVTVDAHTPIADAADRLSQVPGNMLIVVREGRPVGLLTPSLLGGLIP